MSERLPEARLAEIRELLAGWTWHCGHREPERIVRDLLAEVDRFRALEVPAANQSDTEDRCEYSGEQGLWPGALRCPLPMRTHYHYCERPGSGVEVVYYGSDRARQIEAKERFGG